MRTYLCVYLGAAFAAGGLALLMIRLAWRFKVLDEPGLRRVHERPVPRLGGVAIAVPILAVIAAVFVLDNVIGEAFREVQSKVLALLGGAAFLLFVGLVDDIRPVRARLKLVAQVVAASFVCLVGIRIESVTLQGWFSVEFGMWAWPITIFWIVGMTNALNLIDGLDGLAAGIAAIACGVVAAFAVSTAQSVMAVLMLSCVGALTGFLIFNFNPARIFLGDSGTYFLGFVLGSASVLSATKSEALVGLALPLVAMGVPIFDTLFAIVRRFLERRPLFAPDRGHIHHRLIQLGVRQRHAVILLYGVTVVIAGLGMFLMITQDLRALGLFACLIVLVVLAFRLFGAIRLRETLAGIKHRRAIDREVSADRDSFQEAELILREATTFERWWQALCAAAQRLEFTSLGITFTNRDGTTRSLVWRENGRGSNGHECTQITVPIPDRRSGPPLKAEAEVGINGSLEATGRHVALFSRLVDTYGLVSLPRSSSGQESHAAQRHEVHTTERR